MNLSAGMGTAPSGSTWTGFHAFQAPGTLAVDGRDIAVDKTTCR